MDQHRWSYADAAALREPARDFSLDIRRKLTGAAVPQRSKDMFSRKPACCGGENGFFGDLEQRPNVTSLALRKAPDLRFGPGRCNQKNHFEIRLNNDASVRS